MTHLENLPAHLKTLTKSKWQKLFDLLPAIERTRKFGVLKVNDISAEGINILPYWEHALVVSKFSDVVYDLEIVVVFDWSAWDEGREILQSEDKDFSKMDIITLCKLITCIVRADRFSDGTLIGNFSDGTIQKIIRAIQSILLR